MLEIHFPKETENTMFFWSAHYQRIYSNVQWNFDCRQLKIFFENTLKLKNGNEEHYWLHFICRFSVFLPEQEYFEGRKHWKLRPLFKDTFHFQIFSISVTARIL